MQENIVASELVARHPEWPDLSSLSAEEAIASVEVWYHTLDLAGHVTPGCYDMRTVVSNYELPEDMSGLRIIDVGASNGFFSFLFEQRGAKRVISTELGGYKDHDYPPWYLEQEFPKHTPEEHSHADWHQLHGGYLVAHKLLGSRAERVISRVYDLPKVVAETIGEADFDLAFCSNVLVHLRDPVGALQAIRAVVRPGGRAIFATPVLDEGQGNLSAVEFVGEHVGCTWWVPTPVALSRMCVAAGFVNVRVLPSFDLGWVNSDSRRDLIGVVHCERPE